jgi:hypothetical protein
MHFQQLFPKSFLVAAFSFFLFIPNLVQAQDFEWAISGQGGPNYSRDLAVDKRGNIHVIGNFKDTVDFDPGPGVTKLISTGSEDLFIQKIDSAGDLVWVKSISGPSH